MASEARPPPSDLVNSIFKHARARALQQTSPQAPANMPVRLIYHWRSSSQTGNRIHPMEIHGTVFPKLIIKPARSPCPPGLTDYMTCMELKHNLLPGTPSTWRSMDIHGNPGNAGNAVPMKHHGSASPKKMRATKYTWANPEYDKSKLP